MDDPNMHAYDMLDEQARYEADRRDAERYAARRKAIFLSRQRMQLSGPRQTEAEFNAEYDLSCDRNLAGYVTDHRGVWVKDESMAGLCNCAPAPEQVVLYARRYAYLRERNLDAISSGGVFAGMTPENVVLNGDDLDAAIDASLDVAPNARNNRPPLGGPVD